MPGVSQLTIGHVLNTSAANVRGYREFMPLAIGEAFAGTSPLSGSTSPAIIAWATNMLAVRWLHSHGTSHAVAWTFRMPLNYGPVLTDNSNRTDDVRVIVPARKFDAGGDENPTLALVLNVHWFTPGDADISSLTTPVSVTLAAAIPSPAPAGLAFYTFNVGNRLREEKKRIKPGDLINIVIAPSSTVGTTDMVLEMLPPSLVYRANPAFTNTTAR